MSRELLTRRSQNGDKRQTVGASHTDGAKSNRSFLYVWWNKRTGKQENRLTEKRMLLLICVQDFILRTMSHKGHVIA
jgi:hypothetical protein